MRRFLTTYPPDPLPLLREGGRKGREGVKPPLKGLSLLKRRVKRGKLKRLFPLGGEKNEGS